jgi:Flp pilus assembly secretin CpaC
VQISKDVFALRINSRSAETTVTVQDGHTIVLGGLISTSDQTVENKVPFLGDIPLLGWLFKYSSTQKKRTELLIIMTPTVIRNVPQADATTQAQVKRLTLLREAGKRDTLQKSIFRPLNGEQQGESGAAGKESEKTPPLAPDQMPAEILPPAPPARPALQPAVGRAGAEGTKEQVK